MNGHACLQGAAVDEETQGESNATIKRPRRAAAVRSGKVCSAPISLPLSPCALASIQTPFPYHASVHNILYHHLQAGKDKGAPELAQDDSETQTEDIEQEQVR